LRGSGAGGCWLCWPGNPVRGVAEACKRHGGFSRARSARRRPASPRTAYQVDVLATRNSGWRRVEDRGQDFPALSSWGGGGDDKGNDFVAEAKRAAVSSEATLIAVWSGMPPYAGTASPALQLPGTPSGRGAWACLWRAVTSPDRDVRDQGGFVIRRDRRRRATQCLSAHAGEARPGAAVTLGVWAVYERRRGRRPPWIGGRSSSHSRSTRLLTVEGSCGRRLRPDRPAAALRAGRGASAGVLQRRNAEQRDDLGQRTGDGWEERAV